MTTYSNDFSGGTNAATITGANSGGASGDAFSTVTQGDGVTYDNTHVYGVMACKIATGSQITCPIWQPVAGAFSNGTFWLMIYVPTGASIPANFTIAGFYSGSTVRVRVSLSTTLKVVVNSTGGGTATSTNSIPTGQMCLIEASAVLAAGTGGSITVNIYSTPTGPTPLETFGQTGVNYGGTADRIRLGKGTAPASAAPDFWFGMLKANDTGATFGPLVPAFTGTGASTAPAATQSASGTVTVPAFTGTAASTAPSATQAAAGTVTAPAFTGTAASTAPNATQAANGTTVAPDFTGTASSAAPAATQTASGTTTVPAFTGTAASTAPPATQSATGGTVPPDYTGTASSTAPSATQDATGVASGLTFTGEAASTAPAATQAAFGFTARYRDLTFVYELGSDPWAAWVSADDDRWVTALDVIDPWSSGVAVGGRWADAIGSDRWRSDVVDVSADWAANAGIDHWASTVEAQ